MRQAPKQEYRISVGNTRTDVVGLCFSVTAKDRREALQNARRALEFIESVALNLSETGGYDGRIYFNSRNLKASDIADVREPTP